MSFSNLSASDIAFLLVVVAVCLYVGMTFLHTAVIAVVVFAAALFCAGRAHATDGTVVGLHVGTAHSSSGLRSSNPGLYLRTSNGFTAGFFRNSYDRDSAYAGWTVETEGRRFALTVGAVTGYPARQVLPLVVPSVRIGITERASARIAYMHKPPRYGRAYGAHLSFEYQL